MIPLSLVYVTKFLHSLHSFAIYYFTSSLFNLLLDILSFTASKASFARFVIFFVKIPMWMRSIVPSGTRFVVASCELKETIPHLQHIGTALYVLLCHVKNGELTLLHALSPFHLDEIAAIRALVGHPVHLSSSSFTKIFKSFWKFSTIVLLPIFSIFDNSSLAMLSIILTISKRAFANAVFMHERWWCRIFACHSSSTWYCPIQSHVKEKIGEATQKGLRQNEMWLPSLTIKQSVNKWKRRFPPSWYLGGNALFKEDLDGHPLVPRITRNAFWAFSNNDELLFCQLASTHRDYAD